MSESHKDAHNAAYPPRGGGILGVPRAFLALGLVWTQLVVALFLFEIPMHLADRLSKRRGDAFSWVQRAIARWFFRLYPFGRLRRVNVSRATFRKPCVIVCNQQSRLDILAALTLPANARWLVRSWMYKLPLLGELFKLGRHIDIIDRSRAGSGTEAGIEDARKRLEEGLCILAFPEEHRSRDGRIGHFRNAAFQIAIEAKKPVVPVVIEGTGAALQKGDLGMRSPSITLRALEPIDTAAYQGEGEIERLKADTRAKMVAALKEVRDSSSLFALPNGLITRTAAALVFLAIASLVTASIYVNTACIAKPPSYSGSRGLQEKQIGSFQDARTLGDSWTRTRDGITEVALSGNPWERGYASAKFTPEQLKAQETHLLKTVDEFLPWPKGPVRWVLKLGIGINNRNLPDYVSQDEQLEILGLTEGSIDHHPDDVPLYHRVLNYHAAHDISHMLIDNPLIVKKDLIGCTGLAVWGPATKEGNLIVSRNFDWEGGDIFDVKKVIFYVWPDKGIPYVHVMFSGMVGAATGMNARGIAVSLNAARTDDSGKFGKIGTPVSLVVKRVLNEAENIEQAVKIIREAQVFVSDSYLVASRDEKRAVVVEKSPTRCEVREAEKPGMLLQTNHFLAKGFDDDKANQEHTERATTLYRYQRLKELVEKDYGSIQYGTTLHYLRDKKGKGGKELGMGNRNAIDAMICTHSVIMDVTNGLMWVGSGPHTIGEYVRVEVGRMLDATPQSALRHVHDSEQNLPRDMDYFARVLDFIEFKKQLKIAKEAIDDDDIEKAKPAVKTLVNLNRDAFETAYYEGRLAWLEEKYGEAKKKFEAALSRDPHYEEVREEIRRWLKKAEEK